MKGILQGSYYSMEEEVWATIEARCFGGDGSLWPNVRIMEGHGGQMIKKLT